MEVITTSAAITSIILYILKRLNRILNTWNFIILQRRMLPIIPKEAFEVPMYLLNLIIMKV